MSDFDPRGLGTDEAANHPLLSALLAELWPSSPAPPLAIDPRDEMLDATRELLHGDRDAALVAYFLAGITAARTFEELLEHRAPRRSSEESRSGRRIKVLDFAAGWGRVTRFLAVARPDLDITVSDISPEAVAFQQRVLGLPGFVSAARPEDLRIPEEDQAAGFDVVLVTSLFTHLPERTFVTWLQRLLALVAPGGVLAVSTHPEERMPETFEMPPSGLVYEPASEIPHLDVGDYGRTWVTPAFMQGALERAETAAAPRYRRFRRCLWHLQDLWVIARDPGPVEDGLAGPQLTGLDLDGGPDGRLEGISFEDDGSRLWLGGWAAHPLHDDPEVQVEIAVDGRTVASTRPDRPRPDVAERFGRPRLEASGWLVDVPFEDLSPGPTDIVRVRAVDRRGRICILHLSTFEGLVAWQETRRLREELASCRRHLKAADGHLKVDAVEIRDLRIRLSAMEASRFWRLRNLWFRLTGRGPEL